MRRFLRHLLSLSIAFSAAAAHGSDADEDILKSILTARTYSQLKRTAERGHRMRRARLVCDAQLRANRIPIACFDVLAFEVAQTGSSIPEQDANWLESVCSRRASNARDWHELQDTSRAPAVPKKCKAAAEARLADLQYADQSERPAELFNRRFVFRR